MAWENLSSDLADLFGEFTTHADALLVALDKRLEWHRAYHRAWNANKRATVQGFRAQERARLNARYHASEEVRRQEIERVQKWQAANRDRVRANNREYMRKKRALRNRKELQS